MSAIAESLEPAPSQALALAESLEADLLAADTTDPIELGWARDYRVRALYRLGRHQEGLVLVIAPPPRAMAISARNAAWLRSVAAEMALHAGARERIRPLIREALHLRLEDGDQGGVRMAVETGVALLQRAERPTEVEAWLEEVEARASAAEPGSVAAMALSSALSAIARAPWYPEELPSAARRQGVDRLHAAAQAGDLEGLRRALAEGVDPGERHLGWPGLPTPLIAAAFAGHRACVDALIAAGAPLDAVNVQGRSALHLAADQGHGEVVAALCAAGAALDGQDFHGHTPLHLAAWQDHQGALAALCAAGAALERRDVNGDTPLAVAATEPVPAIIRALLAAGAAIEATNDHGQTPIVRAAMEGQAEIVGILLEAGADPQVRDRNGYRAREWAEAQGFDAVLVALESTASERGRPRPRPRGRGTSRRRRD
ncbi:MAG: ankyrin repeat domain-containing protein [Myxococcales bacterium]|nr:ankyrin repeat domain-containing protein [Myxococcales bacterium]